MVTGSRRLRSARAGFTGFTLIELVLAMLLLAVGLLALVGALVRALDEAQRARLRHVALRQSESVADSVVAAPTLAAGARRSGPVRVEWHPVSCAAGACLRLVATLDGHPRDSVSLLVHAPASGDAR